MMASKSLLCRMSEVKRCRYLESITTGLELDKHGPPNFHLSVEDWRSIKPALIKQYIEHVKKL